VFDRLPGEARPLRFGHLVIVVEGVGEEHALLTDDVDRHATPNRPVLRPRPAGIEADRHAVAHAEHEEAGVIALVTGEAVAGFGVDLGHLSVVDPAEDVDDVNGVVDDGAATGERGVDEPAARVRTGVTRGDGQRLADHAAPDRVTQAGDGGVEADRESGHELDAVLLAGVDHRLGVFDGRGKRLLAENVLACLSSGDRHLLMPDILRTYDDGVDIVALYGFAVIREPLP